MSVLAALGSVLRMAFGSLALSMPTPVYGVLITVGFTETLAITSGFALGPVCGFMVGMLIIVVSDLYLLPGPWTPFIGGIIGILGVFGGVLRGRVTPSREHLAVVAVAATLLSEFLQNLWVSLFYSIPLIGVLIAGLPTLGSALINNTVLMTMAGPRIIDLLRSRV